MIKLKYYDGSNYIIYDDVNYTNNIISYTDNDNNLNTIMVIEGDVVVTKSGVINYKIVHAKDQEFNTNIIINLDNNTSSINTNIKTNEVNISDNKIEIKFIKDNEEIINSWEIFYED